jgi:copper resistance protein C
MKRFFALLFLSVLIAHPAVVWAHAKLVKSEPAQRAVLSLSPKQLRLWFNEALEPAFSIAIVLDAAGKRVTEIKAVVSASDARLLELTLPRLKQGVYAVQFQVLSIDGHTVKSGFKFEIREPATPR